MNTVVLGKMRCGGFTGRLQAGLQNVGWLKTVSAVTGRFGDAVNK